MLLAAASAHEARAKDARSEAAALFQSAAEAHRRGDYVTAARTFEAAHARFPSGAALYNAGRAWQDAGQPARAADHFVAALGRGDLAAAQAQDAEKRLRALRRIVAQLAISGSGAGALSAAHVTEAPLPVSMHVVAGEVHLRVTWSNGGTSERIVSIGEGERLTVFFEEPPRAPVPSPAPPATTQPAVPEPDSAWTGLRLYLRAALGPGVLADSLEQSQAPNLKAQGTATGGTLDSELAVGVSVNRQLVFGLAACTAWVSKPKVSFPNDPGLERIGSGAFVITGPFLVWYLRENRGWHVQALLGGAGLDLSDAGGSPVDTRIIGSGLIAGVGYDWWVTGRLRSGAMLRVTGARLASERTQHSMFLASLLWTVTWDARGARPRVAPE